ncbi:protein sprouty [Anastrepha ludens]|uniref:protein sprouty n=1 Tax=Anastrepha ludens TaxID=28586 RepID=UPI0023B075CC|nr:protein sprouty [Anastrepha ludens]XP_053956989.1 protein sprouty [Anastrepha ludens]XP_053956991.1 protein sprouty [Anastrepha ludens]XP_053956992.1 protein sprouty [Anastrepha ludens]XP_053956993.1 protein sprouty [Anastrepha ludens]XP_053956994.1 protein sprouty [Anastrepha ludens]
MDRRNGGDILAPPRPPKHLPRVHRPRAPEPDTMLNEIQMQQEWQQQQQREQEQQQMTTTAVTSATTTSTATPQCTNSNNQQLQHNFNSNNFPSQYSITGVDRGVTTSGQNDNIAIANTLMQPEYEDYEIHHLTILPQRPTTLNLSRNNSHVSNTSSSSSSSITAANTFTRRRQSPPTPGAAARLLVNNNTISSNARSQSSNNSGLSGGITGLLSHFHSTEPAVAASVTLAQPRPESQRLTNEYVDTPFRNAVGNTVIPNQLQLQHASRSQHPAGQHDGGQTTTHHLLLLPQREFRLQQHQHQQQQHQHQLHSNRLAGTVGSAIVATGIDGTDGFLHSNHNHKTPTSTATTTTTCPHTGKVIPVAQNGNNSGGLGSFTSSLNTEQPFTPAITKQPASTTTSQTSHVDSSNCKFAKDLPAFDDLLTMHNIATGIATPQGMISAVHGASPLGTPIIIGGDTSSLTQITCPRCGHCRCEQCQSPPHLPQTWLCNKTCLCSAESVIDYVSCLCCAKALFYHCARDNDMDCDDGSGTPCVDNPCSCGPYKRTQRWGWLGALSLVLPCLWLYWPMRGCVSFCEKCYGRIVGRGCRCQQTDSPTNIIPISQLGLTGNGNSGTASILSSNNAGTDMIKSAETHHHHNHHHHHHHMRKGDLTPKKRLLDSNGEY